MKIIIIQKVHWQRVNMYAILLEVYWVSKKGILHCTIYPWSDQFFLDRFRIASPKDGAADIGQRFIFSDNYGEDLQCTITYQVYIKPAIILGEPFNKTQGFRLGSILTFQWNIIT
jgi:hypothetical protein